MMSMCENARVELSLCELRLQIKETINYSFICLFNYLIYLFIKYSNQCVNMWLLTTEPALVCFLLLFKKRKKLNVYRNVLIKKIF